MQGFINFPLKWTLKESCLFVCAALKLLISLQGSVLFVPLEHCEVFEIKNSALLFCHVDAFSFGHILYLTYTA